MNKYVVLLRGINISGKNSMAMNELKLELSNNYKNVITYLNSGNIILESDINERNKIKEDIELIIKDKFNLCIPVFVITKEELKELLNNQSEWWGLDNKEIYNNIIFIIEPITYKEVYETLGNPNYSLENIKEYKNNIFWSYNLKEYRKTNWWHKTASTSISKKITIRTSNTIKKILELCN